jgi:hypothetical protein
VWPRGLAFTREMLLCAGNGCKLPGGIKPRSARTKTFRGCRDCSNDTLLRDHEVTRINFVWRNNVGERDDAPMMRTDPEPSWRDAFAPLLQTAWRNMVRHFSPILRHH